MDGNPFLINDPVLYFCLKYLSWGAGTVFVLTLVFQVVLPAIWTWSTKTWKDEEIEIAPEFRHPKQGHGFWRLHNSYLLIFPFLNLAIFSYYERVYVYTKILIESGVQFKAPKSQALQTVFEPFTTFYATIIFIIAALVGAVIFYVFTFCGGNIGEGEKKTIPRTDWLYDEGKARPICYVFSIFTHFIQFTIMAGWLGRHLLISLLGYGRLFTDASLGATLVPFHPDGMFGLSALEEIATSTTYVFVALGLVVTLWLLGVITTYGGWQYGLQTTGLPVGIIVFLIIAPYGIAITLEPAREKIVSAKIEALKNLDKGISENSYLLLDTFNKKDDRTLDLSKQWERHKTLEAIYDFISKVPDWPVRASNRWEILLKLVGAVAVPITVNRLIGKARIVTESEESDIEMI